jgi:NAD(P)-dependent dehydrogenase (short-subunit alcohol dehydrogenase family)
MDDMGSLISVTGKNVVVIGGTGNVGKPIVESLTRNGARVISVSRSKTEVDYFFDKKLFKYPGELYTHSCDISTEQGVESLRLFLDFKNFIPDVLVNAVSYRPKEIYLSDSIEKWDEVVSRNSRSMFLLYKTFADLMKAKGEGSVISISSIYAVVAPDPALYEDLAMGTEADYPFIKAGGIALARYFASYYGSKGVRFNSIILGGVFNNQDQTFVDRYIAKVPLGRMANGNDICGAVNLLASSASSYITGSSIYIDGGFTSR